MLTTVYSSIATHPFTDHELAELLEVSRTNNAQSDVTGVLFFKNGYFLQMLEGPDAQVDAKMATIRADARHTKVRILLREITHERQFPEWTMAYAPTDGEAVDAPGYRQTFDDIHTEEDTAGALPALRELMKWFQTHPTHLN